ncbi:MAG: cyclic nucleotide-binding domain-containing protein [Candidatus Riflebacteria bacterium]|nr:cyclic nucleotide-binding domain-containing protein [Candidatus Riflebacteria bacterium]
MVAKISSGSFSPGDHVFLQGEVIPAFFKVNEGKFAKVFSKKSVMDLGIKHMLNEADLVGIVSHQELFGEIEALTGKPQEFSVFALEESSVTAVPADDREGLKTCLSTEPKIGVKACVSFARYMRQFFAHFGSVAREEVELEAFIRGVARDYMAGVNELANAVCPAVNDPDYVAARSHKALELSRHLLRASEAHPFGGSSVPCCVLSDFGKENAFEFKADTFLCREGEVGDTLFILVEGSAEVVTEGNGPNIVIDNPGSIIGEIAVFLNLELPRPDMRRTAAVVCKTDVKAVVLQLDQVEEFFVAHPEILHKMLQAMINRSDNTQKLCEKSESRVKSMLYDTLGVLLEGMNDMALRLSRRNDNQALARPAALFTQCARTVYNRFRESLGLIAARDKIKT